jgi:hypothetical protein
MVSALAVLVLILLSVTNAWAKPRQIVIALEANDVEPQRVCIHVEKLSGEIALEYSWRGPPDARHKRARSPSSATEALRFLEPRRAAPARDQARDATRATEIAPLDVEPPRARGTSQEKAVRGGQDRSEAAMAPLLQERCSGDNSSACDSCKAPPPGFYGVCLETPSAAPADGGRRVTRELHLLLEHAGLERFAMEGKLLRLVVDQSESAAFSPRIEVLGGGYHAGEVAGLHDSDIVSLSLVPRCVERQLGFPVAPGKACDSVVLKTNGEVVKDVNVAMPVLLRVQRSGENTVSTEGCGTTYTGSFGYPPPDTVTLSPKSFPLRWRRSCFAKANGSIEGCPTLSLTRYGHACEPAPEVCGGNECCYKCSPGTVVEFPTPVKFEAVPQVAPVEPDSAQTSTIATTGAADQGAASKRQPLDPIRWTEDARYPGDELSGFVPPEERRVFLRWNPENAWGWGSWGSEIDAIALVGPDGRVHRVGSTTPSIAVPGLQCEDRFTYHYQGRWPDKGNAATLEGDTLALAPPSKNRQDVIMGLRVHAGGLVYTGVAASAAIAPFFDVEFAALVHGGFEFALSGVFSVHPSSAQFGSEDADWDSTALARVLLSAGYRGYLHERIFVSGSLGGGIAFPALASSWNEATEYPILALHARTGYEITRATALEIGAWGFFPEQYIETVYDSAGALAVESEVAVVFGLSAGLQWADVF